MPTKFTYDFLESVLGLTSSSHRALIPILKHLDFLDAAGVPTIAYKDYRGETGKSPILADKIKKAYHGIYKANEYAHTLDKKEVENLVIRSTGASKTDPQVSAAASTFLELVKQADFESPIGSKSQVLKKESADQNIGEEKGKVLSEPLQGFGLSYTINLNLPPTTEIEVFNAIFKSLKENLLDK